MAALDNLGGTSARARGMIDYFAAAWQGGQHARIETFLVARPEAERPALFAALLEVELRARIARGEHPRADEYRLRFPDYPSQINHAFIAPDDPTALHPALLARPAFGPSSAEPLTESFQDKQEPTDHADKPAALPLIPSAASFGRYNILGFLGKGGFGSVYLGFDTQLERAVAIKVPHLHRSTADAVGGFLQEARRVARLKHPGIVTIYDVGVQDGQIYLVTDFIDGVSLAARLREHRPTWQDAVHIAAAVADALACAHEQRVVHRDVKPTNILMRRALEPVLLDFGLALDDADPSAEQRALILGTPHFMSPEQARGESHRIDGRTDIFSLGVVLYYMLTARLPFSAHDKQELLRQVRDDDPQPPRQLVRTVPRELERICLKAMSKRISDRYTTANDFAEELRAILVGDTSIASVPAAVPAPVRPAPAPAAVPPCPRCGLVNPPASRFCGHCGAEQIARTPAAQVVPALPTPVPTAVTPGSTAGSGTGSSLTRAHEAGRRQISVLACRVEAAALGEEFDPEAFAALLPHFQGAVARVLADMGGHSARAEGDTVLAYFGYPIAFEDAARRAVRAGLAVVAAVADLNERVLPRGDTPLAVRVGLQTGLVVTGAGSGGSVRDLALISEPSTVASRLVDCAEAGQVLIGGATQRLVRGFFRCATLGTQSLKGVARSVDLFRVEAQSDALDRLQVAGPTGLTPLIGRDRELELLLDRWNLAREGMGQVVLLLGEPGIGKSRLLYEAKARALAEAGVDGLTLMELRCSPEFRSSGLNPVADALERLLDFQRDTPAAERRLRLDRMLLDLELPAEGVALFAALLGLPPDGRTPLPDVQPERLRQMTLETLLDWLRRVATRTPLLLVVEDLHWIDPSTLELLHLVVDELRNERALALVTGRPEFASPWTSRPHVTQVGLNRLTRAQVTKLIERRAGGGQLPPEVTELFLQRTDGVPLFVEELTRMVLDAGVLREERGRLRLRGDTTLQSAIPDTLQDLLAARLDRVGPAKELAQLGAVLGREFPHELLQAVAGRDDAALNTDVNRLLEAEILFRKGRPPQLVYLFKHALIQDAAYQSLLKSQRQQHHRRVVEVYETRFPEITRSQPELLAYHCTEAGLTQQAVDYWERAGLSSRERSANDEAVAHLEKGLEVLATLPESPERVRQELRLQMPLGTALLSTRGYAAPEVGGVFERARKLCEQAGPSPELFFVLWGLWAWHVVRDELDLCMELMPEVMELARTLGEPSLLTEALFVPGLTRLYRGEFAAVRKDCEEGLAHEDRARCQAHARFTGQNVAVTMRSYLALALWHLGQPGQALRLSAETVALSATLDHPFSHCYALHHACWLEQHCRLGARAQEHGAQLVAVATEQGFAFWRATGTLYSAAALLLQGKTADGAALVQQGLTDYRATGAALALPYYLSFQATALLDSGKPDKALKVLEEAQTIARTQNDLFQMAELQRLCGAARRGTDDGAAEAAFQACLDTARRQGSRAWELRGSLSLARLWKGQGRTEEARTLLAAALADYPAADDTPDVLEARGEQLT